jgi:hypothetical protein
MTVRRSGCGGLVPHPKRGKRSGALGGVQSCFMEATSRPRLRLSRSTMALNAATHLAPT